MNHEACPLQTSGLGLLFPTSPVTAAATIKAVANLNNGRFVSRSVLQIAP